jgi:hypothetical protein
MSCGVCIHGKWKRTHGHAAHAVRTKTYKIWAGMKRRCDNPHEGNYARYGGRGIRYAKRWAKYENFLADMGECSPGMTIERKDPNKGYSKANCRWATAKEQSRNTRRTVWLEYKGERKSLPEWAEQYKVPLNTLRFRIDRGWPVERALSEPVNGYYDQVTYKGKTQHIAEWSRETGIAYHTLYQRLLRYGWTPERALTSS